MLSTSRSTPRTANRFLYSNSELRPTKRIFTGHLPGQGPAPGWVIPSAFSSDPNQTIRHHPEHRRSAAQAASAIHLHTTKATISPNSQLKSSRSSRSLGPTAGASSNVRSSKRLSPAFAEKPATHHSPHQSPRQIASPKASRAATNPSVEPNEPFIHLCKQKRSHKDFNSTLAALKLATLRQLSFGISESAGVTVSSARQNHYFSVLSHRLRRRNHIHLRRDSSKIYQRFIGSYPPSITEERHPSHDDSPTMGGDKTVQPDGYTFPDHKLKRVLSGPNKIPLVFVACGRYVNL